MLYSVHRTVYIRMRCGEAKLLARCRKEGPEGPWWETVVGQNVTYLLFF